MKKGDNNVPMAQRHPDFSQESERLQMTKAYMKKMIEIIIENRSKQRAEMKQAMIDYDYLDSSQSYITILVNAQLLEYGEKNFDQFTRGLKKPYFARIDFKEDGSQEFKRYYIGKLSLLTQEDREPLIIDWRSPIASVYYDGLLGEVEYTTPTSKILGVLGLKRQLVIEDGELIDVLDIDITTNDAFLQASLEASVDNRLKDIANSIQAEQNKVIRADINKPLIVQGVAGSGKTTIALHRIAYLIYTYEDRFIPENFVILAPNRLFINYISDALPELGAERIQQTALNDFMVQLIGKAAKFKIISSEVKFLKLLKDSSLDDVDREKALIIKASQFKGSMLFKRVIDAYVRKLKVDIIPTVDFQLEEYTVLEAVEIRRIFLEEYSFLPLQRRMEMIEKILKYKLKALKPIILEEVENEFNGRIEEVRNSHYTDEDKRRERVVALADLKKQTLAEINKKAKTAVKKYMTAFPALSLKEHYINIVGNKQTIAEHNEIFQDAHAYFDEEILSYMCDYSSELLRSNRIEVEDLPALTYLKHQLIGKEDDLDIRHVFIDEAQDLSVFQVYALRDALNTTMFTIIGDIAQGIHSYRSIRDWKEIIEGVFPDLDCQFLTLEQSYRTTIEIMQRANQVISEVQTGDIILAKPVIRHGEPPIERSFSNVKELAKNINETVNKLQSKGYKSIALIGKTLKECELLHRQLTVSTNILQGDEVTYEGEVLVIPAYIAKGLEFDAVVIFTIQEQYTKKDLDLKLLYVAMTRPRQLLYIMSVDATH